MKTFRMLNFTLKVYIGAQQQQHNWTRQQTRAICFLLSLCGDPLATFVQLIFDGPMS